MEAIVRNSLSKRDVSLGEVPRPDPGEGEVQIAVEAAGVCGSDVGAYLGKPEYDFMDVPAVLGHEFTGTVSGVGDGVHSFAEGDRVVVWPGTACGECFQCRSGQENVCPEMEAGDLGAGGFAPYATASASNLHRVPDAVGPELAALTEPLAVTHRTVVRNGEVRPGDSVLVQGPGPMGALSALLARRAGGDVVVSGLERDRERLATLADLGFETFDAAATAPAAAATEYARHDGFDVVVDATGSAAGVEAGAAATRKGGRVVVVGIPSDPVSLDATTLVRSEIDVRTSYGAVGEDFQRVLALLASPDRPPVEAVVDDGFTPRDPTAAFEAFADAGAIKPLLDPSELAG